MNSYGMEEHLSCSENQEKWIEVKANNSTMAKLTKLFPLSYRWQYTFELWFFTPHAKAFSSNKHQYYWFNSSKVNNNTNYVFQNLHLSFFTNKKLLNYLKIFENEIKLKKSAINILRSPVDEAFFSTSFIRH